MNGRITRRGLSACAAMIAAAAVSPSLSANPPSSDAEGTSDAAAIGAFRAAHTLHDACWRIAGVIPHPDNEEAYALSGRAFRPVEDRLPRALLERVQEAWERVSSREERSRAFRRPPRPQPVESGCSYGPIFQPLRIDDLAFVHALVPGTRRAWDVFQLRDSRWIRVATTGAYRREPGETD